MAPRQGVPALGVVVADDTGDVVAVSTGRRHIGGVSHGRHIGGVSHGRLVVLDGMVREERGRTILLNPAYTLVAD